MHRAAIVILMALLGGCTHLMPPPDLPTAKERVAVYMEEGRYERDVRTALRPAWRLIDRVCKETDRVPAPAIVLDIDETSLSNYEYEKGLNFGHYGPAFYQWIEERRASPNTPVLALYQRARACGIAVFFVTGRRQRFRDATETNLRRAGYADWAGLFLKPDDYDRRTAVPYKSACRKEIEEKGYEIILNIGDQHSDLAGGHATTRIKLPNPMYRVD